MYDVTQDPAWKTWQDRRTGRLGRSSKRTFEKTMIQSWCTFNGKTLSDMIQERLQHTASTDMQVRSYEENKLQEFLQYLRTLTSKKTGKPLSPNSIFAYWSVVHSFYAYHNLKLQDKTPKTWTQTEYHPCTIDDVRAVYALAEIPAKFILNYLVHTGHSNIDMVELSLGSTPPVTTPPGILEQLNTGRQYVTVRCLREKTKVRFRFHLSPEVVNDLQAYLQYRKHAGETITDKSPLLVGERGGKVDYKDVNRMIRTAAQRAGREWMTPKILRKVFSQIVKNQGLHDHSEYWMGHAIPKERRAYFDSMPDDSLIHEYKKVERWLSLAPQGSGLDEKKLRMQWNIDMIQQTNPEIYAEFLRMKGVLEAQGRALSTDDALKWIGTELMKRGPTGGLAWTRMNKKDRLSKVLAMLGEVLSEGDV